MSNGKVQYPLKLIITSLAAGKSGIEPPIKFSKGGGLTGPQLIKWGCWERGGAFFMGGCSFYIKNKLKSDIFHDKKKFINKQKCFFLPQLRM